MPQVYNVGARSLLVNLVAWLVIVLSAGSVAALAAHHGELAPLLQHLAQGPLEPMATWMTRHQPWMMAAAGMTAGMLCAVAVGLLRRLEWARRSFIVIASAALVALVAGLSVQHELVALAVQQAVQGSELSAATLALIDQLTVAARALAYALWAAACLATVALVRALLSQEVRQEFA